MLGLKDYEISREKIYQSPSSVVYRGKRKSDGRTVILKVHAGEYPTTEQITRYIREYEVTRRFQSEGIIQAYELVKSGRAFVMVLEDFGGRPLKSLIGEDSLSLTDVLELGVQLARTLGEIHQHNIIHKDINPSNILYNPATATIKFIDFGISTALSRETFSIKNPVELEGTPAYMSPEQTGRMNRALDYRSDFYSLGATLYELLTGRAPFESDDPVELVHSHIARTPIPPAQVEPSIPDTVSAIIMKLLAKTAEERYQSAAGLERDLKECVRQLKESGSIIPFQPGGEDRADRFQIPQNLYGREREVRQLLSGFERVSGGSTLLMLVAGYSGIGKTALVQELYRPITRTQGYYISGKFDQFQRNVPYSALVRAFQDLVRQLLTESDESLRRRRESLLEALGPNGQLIIDVIPEVELIIGAQPPVQQLGPVETRNRFNLVFQNFLRVFCETPLAIFLDDLQWADAASLKLIETILNNDRTERLYLIGAYRDNEVDENHGLSTLRKALIEEGVKVEECVLGPLRQEHLIALVTDTLHSADHAQELAGVLEEKTGGNPFFANQFLFTLHREGLFEFDAAGRCWRPKMDEINRMQITDNVVELMVRRLRRLPPAGQKALSLAAFTGNSFDLGTLSTILEQSPAETSAALEPAIQEGLLIPLSNQEAERPDDTQSRLIFNNYKFLHDRVQQAAYALVDESDKAQTHLRIGRLQLRRKGSGSLDVVSHLNRGAALITDKEEMRALARMNLEAALKAKASLAYRASLNYLTQCMEIYPGDIWSDDYDLAVECHRERAETEYLNGDVKSSEARLHEMLDRVKTDLEKAAVHIQLLVLYDLTTQTDLAFESAYTAADMLGVPLPRENKGEFYMAELAKIQEYLRDRNILDLVNQPEIRDPAKQLAMRLFTYLLPPAFQFDPELLAAMTARAANITLNHGMLPEAAFLWSALGILASAANNYDDAYNYANLGLSLAERFDDLHQQCLTRNVIVGHTHHWKRHIKYSVEEARAGIEAGFQSGEHQYVAYIMLYLCANKFHQGAPLEDLKEETSGCLDFARKTRHNNGISILGGLDHALHQLRAETDEEAEKWNQEYKELLAGVDVPPARAMCLATRLFVEYLAGDMESALATSEEAAPFMAAAPGIIVQADHNFVSSLIQAQRCDDVNAAPAELRDECKAKIAKNQELMKLWYDHCPENFECRYLLIQAELARLDDKGMQAINLYEEAITSARKNGFIQVEAVANERAAKFWLAAGHERMAMFNLREARHAYDTWGAPGRVRHLDAAYPGLARNTASRGSGTLHSGTNTGRRTTMALALDLRSLLKAAAAISGEIVLEQLMRNMMNIVMENAGAQKGLLLLNRDGRFLLEAEAAVDSEDVVLAEHVPFDQTDCLAAAIVNYAMRTHDFVVVDDAADDERFHNDPYVKKSGLKSVLCIPLLYQGKLIAIVYLENNLAAAAFTPERVETLHLLAAQTAVSLQNALLYESLEVQVRERTAQLIESEKMAALGGLVAGVAHEINTPVGIGVTAASTLQEETRYTLEELTKTGGLNPTVQEYMDTANDSTKLILSNLRKAAELIQSFKQVAVDQHSHERRKFKVRDYIQEILASLKPRLQEAHHAVRVSGDENIVMDSYPGPLSQIITNLLTNTLAHGFPDGQVGEITIDIDQRGDYARIVYSDNGRGIPREELQRVFEPFYSTNRERGGTGLGLHIVYNLVTQSLGGRINVESARGEGVRFSLDLPITIP